MNIPAAIVAGGEGLRMRSVTDLPKSLLPVGDEPLLSHQLNWLEKSGIRRAHLCLGRKAAAVLDYLAARGNHRGLAVETHIEEEALGTAGAVRALLPFIEDDLLVIYGDVFIDMDCAKLLRFHAGHQGAATVVAFKTDHPYDSDLVRLEGDRIAGFYRAKPGEPTDGWAAAAVWVLRRRLLEAVADNVPSDFGKDVFPAAVQGGEVLMAYRTDETLADLGTPERYESFLKSRRARGARA